MLVGGDVIVAVNGEQVSDMMTLQQILAQYAAGDEVTLTVLRDGEQMEVSLTLAPRPQ